MNIFSQIIILVITGILSYKGKVSLGSIISVVSISGQLFNSLDEFGESYAEAISSNFLLKKYSLMEKANPRDKIILRESIKLKNLYYNYGNEQIKFPDIIFNAGGKYIISGKSGVGDSDIMMTDTINPLKSKFKGFHKTFKQDDLGLSLSSFLLN